MRIHLKTIFLSAAAGALLLPVAAQTNSPGIDKRQENQQQRIGNGVGSGQLTAGEAARLERKEAVINKEEQRMKSDGNLSAKERARLQHQESVMSRRVYKQKHDAQVQRTNPKTELGQRQRNQQERIAQGIKSGELTAGETAHLERREAAVNREIRRDRVDGGGMTQAERAKINHQQNKTSRQIYHTKHNPRQR